MKPLKYLLVVLFSIVIISLAVAMNWQDATHSIPGKKEYTIIKTWEMPKELDEISGITWISDHTVASIQDEDGIIFIYDLNKKDIVQKIDFADKGDYEGIAINGNDAYVMRSDGVIFEILNYRDAHKKISHFETDFSDDNNMETLVFDPNVKALITAPKDRGLNSDAFKGLYHISIASKTVAAKPFLKIDMKDDALKEFQKKKIRKTFNPSDVAIHPKTGDYYVLEGKKPKLLILDSDGSIKNVYKLDTNDFAQPEGLTFSPDGALYISNEAHKGRATILQVNFN